MRAAAPLRLGREVAAATELVGDGPGLQTRALSRGVSLRTENDASHDLILGTNCGHRVSGRNVDPGQIPTSGTC